MNTLESLFNPNSIAIVGVSKDTSKIGNVVLKNLIGIGYKKNLYLVNPKYDEIDGIKCYHSLEDIELQREIDVVCIVVPKDFVKDIVAYCVKIHVKNIIIITAGFKEIGEEGKELEAEIQQIINGTKTRILGPNCLGLISPHSNTNISFAKTNPNIGDIAFFSQSGALCTAILDKSISDNLGFSYFVSTGNEVDIKETELFNYFLNDTKTRVISAYIEGIEKGLGLLRAYSKSKVEKPFLIFKPGKSSQAKTAMLSHTGAIADDNKVFQTAIEKYGIINVKSVEQLYMLMKGFSWGKEINGDRVAIVTNAGGPGIIATDTVIEKGFKLAKLTQHSIEELKSVLPNFASVNNPIDILGDAKSDRYDQSLNILINDENIDAIFVILTPQYVTEIEKTAEIIINISKSSPKPIIPIFLGEQSIKIAKDLFNKAQIPFYIEIDDAVEISKIIYDFSNYKTLSTKRTFIELTNIEKGKYKEDIERISGNIPMQLPDQLTEKILTEVEITIPTQKLCENISEAISFAKQLYPVVLKAPNSLIVHKTDIKALYINIKDETELITSINNLKDNIQKNTGNKLTYFLIQKQMTCSEELFLGIKRDGNSEVYKTEKGFGHIILFGKGGIYSEIYQDFAFEHIPYDLEDIIKMISKTKISNILVGARGKNELAIHPLVVLIQKIQKLILMYPQIETLDINPLFIDENNVTAVDVKINIAN